VNCVKNLEEDLPILSGTENGISECPVAKCFDYRRSVCLVQSITRRSNIRNTEIKCHVATAYTGSYYTKIIQAATILSAVLYFRRLLSVHFRVQSQSSLYAT
jgi:hypothetical protein